jgi:hypothetical protein
VITKITDTNRMALADSTLVSFGINSSRRQDSKWKSEISRIRSLRGEIIVRCFELESSIDDAIADLILPVHSLRSPAWLQERHLDFHQEILSRQDLRWKVNLLHSLLIKRISRGKERINTLHSLLNQIRSLRNSMAHCPVRFEVKKARKGAHQLRVFLDTSKGPLQVTQGLIDRYKSNVADATDLLFRLMGQIRRRKTHIRIESV